MGRLIAITLLIFGGCIEPAYAETLCIEAARFEWTRADGPAWVYAVYLADAQGENPAFYQPSLPPGVRSVVVVPAEYQPFTVRASAVTLESAEGPVSDASAVATCGPDLGGPDGIVGLADFREALTPFSLARLGWYRRVFSMRVVGAELGSRRYE